MAECVHALTQNTLAPKSENLHKFHYLWVSISSFVILKMESARFSILIITGTNAWESNIIQFKYCQNLEHIGFFWLTKYFSYEISFTTTCSITNISWADIGLINQITFSFKTTQPRFINSLSRHTVWLGVLT